MERAGNRAFGVALIFICARALAAAEAPAPLSFEGRLLRSDGTGETGAVTLILRLYETATGGTDVWSEMHPLILAAGGYYAVELGGDRALPPFDGRPYWLGVQVFGELEMSPRTRVASVAYALRSNSAANVEPEKTCTGVYYWYGLPDGTWYRSGANDLPCTDGSPRPFWPYGAVTGGNSTNASGWMIATYAVCCQ